MFKTEFSHFLTKEMVDKRANMQNENIYIKKVYKQNENENELKCQEN